MTNEKKKEVTAVAEQPKNVADAVLARVMTLRDQGGLTIPEDYSPENALKSAWLVMQEVEDKNHNKALEVCSRESVVNALLDMVVQGLTPGRKQCYFVVYGKELTLMRSYMGAVAVAKRFAGVQDVSAQIVYEGDLFEYEVAPAGGIKVIKHVQKLENVNIEKIKAAYATVVKADGNHYQELMTKEQILKAWGQGATKGASPAHKNFAEEMSKKTVINRACKMFINTSSDAPILAEAYNRTVESDYKDLKDQADETGVVYVDEKDIETVQPAKEAIFGKQEEKQDPNALTEEEKAQIEIAETKEAKNELESAEG
jgi:recombination protein RecT